MSFRSVVPAAVFLLLLLFCSHRHAEAGPFFSYDLTAVRVILNGQPVAVPVDPAKENYYKAFPQSESDWPSHVNVEVEWQFISSNENSKCYPNSPWVYVSPSSAIESLTVTKDGDKITGYINNMDRGREITATMRCVTPNGEIIGEPALVRLAREVDLEWNPYDPAWQDHPLSEWCETNVVEPVDGSRQMVGKVSIIGLDGYEGHMAFVVERAKEWHTGVYGDITLPEGMVYVTEWDEIGKPMLEVKPGLNTLVWSRNPEPGYYRGSVLAVLYPCPWRYFWIGSPKAVKVPMQATTASGIPAAGQSVATKSSSKGGFGSAAMVLKDGQPSPQDSDEGEDHSGTVRTTAPTLKRKSFPSEGAPSPESGKNTGTPDSGKRTAGFGAGKSWTASAGRTPFHTDGAKLSVKKLSLSPSPLKAGDKARFEIIFENGGKTDGSPDTKYGVGCTVLSGGGTCPVPTGIFLVGKTIPAGASAEATLSAGKPAEPGEYRVEVTLPPNAVKNARLLVIEVPAPPSLRKALKKTPAVVDPEPKVEQKSTPQITPRLQRR